MNTKSNRILIALVSFSVLFSQSAIAARMGGGRSIGMQRSISKPINNSYSRQTVTPQQIQTVQQVQPQRQGMSAGTGALLGAAAGVAGGYMLGKSMANDNTNKDTNPNNAQQSNTNGEQNSAVAPTKSESNIPWGIIAILVALLVIGLAIFRRKSSPQLAQPNNLGNNNFKIPGINKNNQPQMNNYNRTTTQQYVGGFFNGGNQQSPVNISENDRMPDGIEIQYFLRQAKGMFLHIQSMNTPDNVNEVAKYMTPDLYNALKSEVENNKFVGDFSQLDCQLLECDNSTPSQIIAMVQFSGMVSEEPNQPAVKFSEIWNFYKEIPNGKWIVAGIQQTNTIN